MLNFQLCHKIWVCVLKIGIKMRASSKWNLFSLQNAAYIKYRHLKTLTIVKFLNHFFLRIQVIKSIFYSCSLMPWLINYSWRYPGECSAHWFLGLIQGSASASMGSGSNSSVCSDYFVETHPYLAFQEVGIVTRVPLVGTLGIGCGCGLNISGPKFRCCQCDDIKWWGLYKTIRP